jgi:hypothetical protein
LGGRSFQRLPPLEAWARLRVDADALYRSLNQSTSPVFHHGYLRGGSGTLHTMVTEPAKARVMFGIGGDAALPGHDMIDLDFAAWPDGADLALTRLAGQLGGSSGPSAWPVPRAPKKVHPKRNMAANCRA